MRIHIYLPNNYANGIFFQVNCWIFEDNRQSMHYFHSHCLGSSQYFHKGHGFLFIIFSIELDRWSISMICSKAKVYGL